ncbi:hypothetical protein CVT24_007172 [Panaeolus cyanescens]|uniref:Uncharacterized protein n=1 Tax=Panaeolus cyanescens TaxID=181874 RepID=A0A409YPJ3_9AGAR|nr:hypothetical protein CVT24_007172 [Panaeolus cyanescens]
MPPVTRSQTLRRRQRERQLDAVTFPPKAGNNLATHLYHPPIGWTNLDTASEERYISWCKWHTLTMQAFYARSPRGPDEEEKEYIERMTGQKVRSQRIQLGHPEWRRKFINGELEPLEEPYAVKGRINWEIRHKY